ncbi:MAG: SurA N-terminal domain-containing protein [Methylovulum sp.]|uniref:SurA N-terminal domain-containing protein n=1 Tax=Methylovulum sp. TaxID=1916980 RepID=UPI00260DF2C0|nr:SurA N-terminal domain-containing protein [Methylovulum sp.]MDD2725551.1 SurA N-terminal domain-containing protein [Methylovulum sp.]MDD5124094.1 SurA N-terminal domain-containing protein [Methylovulum sp.]
MLTTIREKSQGAFAWGILILIGVPFALWGINNYMDNGKEPPVASVGDKDFYQRDVNKAYEQYSQSMRGLGVDEQTLKAQALQKLIKDEVLLQYVQTRGLAATDDGVREFIKSLEYFQTDGRFDDTKYKSLLATQQMSSNEFVGRVKNAMVMEQFQHSIVDSSFASQYDVESFFKIQNQQRDVDYLTVPLQAIAEQPKQEDISAYYQQHQNAYQAPEQLSIEYVELSLAGMAKKIAVTEEKLKAFYEEQKDQYTTPERRKISHILFAVNDKVADKDALEKAMKAKQELAGKDFAKLAEELSDDKATAKMGGDLGLFSTGVMEKNFEVAATALKQGEVSEPVKSAFGYHLIKVTGLVAAQIKPYESIKNEVTKAYQKAQAENLFYEAGEKLAEISYQNPDNLQTVADELGLEIKKSALFTKEHGEGIAADDKIRSAVFTDEVLQGNNSAPVELGGDVVVVLRMQEHKPAAVRELEAVKPEIAAILSNDKAKQLAVEKAKQIKARLQAGEAIQTIAAENKFDVKSAKGLTRRKSDVPVPLNQAIFIAAKPIGNKPNIFIAPLDSGGQVVVSLTKVTEGVMGDSDKKQLELAKKNIGDAMGQTEFNAVLNSLQADADISIQTKSQAVAE